MFDIRQLLEKFRHLKDPIVDKNKVVEIIKNEIGIDISAQSVVFKSDSVFLNIEPTIKMAVYMKKKVLLEKLTQELPEKIILDIR